MKFVFYRQDAKDAKQGEKDSKTFLNHRAADLYVAMPCGSNIFLCL
jgi:hypothetical protein